MATAGNDFYLKVKPDDLPKYKGRFIYWFSGVEGTSSVYNTVTCKDGLVGESNGHSWSSDGYMIAATSIPPVQGAKLEPQTQLFPIKTGERFHIDHEFNAQTPVYDSKVPTGFFGVSAEIPVTFILYATIGVPRLIHARSVGPLDIGRVVGIDTMFVGGRAKAVLSLKTNVREGDYVTNLKQYDPSAIEFEFHIPKGQNVQEIFA